MYKSSVLLLMGWIFSWLVCTPVVAQSLAQKPKHVVLIGVDGMSPDGISKASTPNLDRLMAKGASTMTARAVLPTSSSTNWKSMVSASGPEQHGVTSNGWEQDDFSLPPATTGMEDIFPTLFGQYRLQRPDAQIGAVYTWGGFARLIERSALSYDQKGESDQHTMALARTYLVEKQPEFLFIHLDEVDGAGHHHGHKTPDYYQAISEADRLIGELVAAAAGANMLKDTVFIITSDHGGFGYGHGGETLDEILIPFVLYGQGVKPDYRIQDFVYTYDSGATVAWLLDMQEHPSWIGKAIVSGFSGYPDPAPLASAGAQTVLAAPILYPEAHLYESAGGLYIDKAAEVKIKATVAGAEVRYTLDGSEPTRNSARYQKPFKLERSAVLRARQFSGQEQSPVTEAYYHVVKSNSGQGIRYGYFEGDDWHVLPTFATLTAKAEGVSYQFRLADIPKRKQSYAIEYRAWLKIEQPGVHKFYTYSDDGSKLYIGDKEVVNNDGAHGTILRAGEIELTPGYHPIRVTYFNEAGGAWLDVFHKAPGKRKQPIMPEQLFVELPQ
ncbi:alkaline phosphatase family protein [Bowmanella pacifica]|uniref:PA14 domain-containing protein n=1 Tax=Bowmanella pacifica TaxID=502051 RepID=A0A917YVA8_9ALTE|nr:alkaline phosphatase family protein [Bowmanella pacifica]GGO65263.1 hypothetical protein GCM10010982_06650 [Bowmanella pacifica]